MGIWQLIFVGIVGFTILYAWIIGEAEKKWLPITILLILTAVYLFWMVYLKQGFLAIGSVVGALLGTIFIHVADPLFDRTYQKEQNVLNIDYCWNCHHKIDHRKAKVCQKCHKHYICPKCGKCLCDKPGYDPKKDTCKIIEEEPEVKAEVVEASSDIKKKKKEKKVGVREQKEKELKKGTVNTEEHSDKEPEVASKE